LTALLDDWTANGVAVLDRVRSTSPAAYLRVVASLVPTRLDIAPADESAMTDEELREFIAVTCEQMGLPGAAKSFRNISGIKAAQAEPSVPRRRVLGR
jgi:hypothetical protein